MNAITDDTSDYGLMRYFTRATVDRMQGGRPVAVTAMLAFHFAGLVLDARKVIGTITPEMPWGDCPACDCRLIPGHWDAAHRRTV